MTSADTTKKALYGHLCEHCDGTVRPKKVDREAFKHKKGFIILEGITVGVCDACGMRYYSADILHAVHDIATNPSIASKKFLYLTYPRDPKHAKKTTV